MTKNGGKVVTGQGSRQFNSGNNFFNPRTAGAVKHPNRDRISSHHFQPKQNELFHSSHGEPRQADEPVPGSIFMKQTFSPRLKIGQPPASSGLPG